MEQETKQPDDPLSPKVTALEGTVLQNPFSLEDDDDGHGNDLFESHSDIDESHGDLLSRSQAFINGYWYPQSPGDINIISKDLARALAALTGCSFHPDNDGKRIGVSGVRFAEAISKLERLEKLQVR